MVMWNDIIIGTPHQSFAGPSWAISVPTCSGQEEEKKNHADNATGN
jgi:hypothetical protein